MQIKSRFLIMLGVLFIAGGTMAVVLVNQQMRTQALFEAESKALAALENNFAISTYFSQQLKPNLFKLTDPIRSKDYFEPTWMSSTYAKREINKYRKSPVTTGYYYKECAINARSPENEANNYEKEFLEALSKDPKLMVSSGRRILQGKPYFVVLRRGEAMEASCLRCHGNPEQAPGGLVRYYGPERSFHRKVGEVVQAISIRVPLSVAFAEANRLSLHLSVMLLMLFMLLFGVLYWLSRRWVFRPLDHIREKALLISTSSDHLGEEIPLPAGRELYDLTTSFNKMSESLRLDKDHLEERVKQRTEELSLSNEHLKQAIQERLRMEEELRASEERYRALFDHMNDGVAIYRAENDGEDFVFVDFNRSGEKIDNVRKEDLIGKSVLTIFPGVKDFGLFDVFKRVWKTGKSEDHPTTLYKDERISGWRDNFVYKLPSGEIGAVYSDETERKQADEQIKASLKEKEVLLKEIHHRVKNNMQVISSLLNLQTRKIKDKDTVELFKEIQNQIRSMTLVHDKLYRSGNLAGIDFKGYVESLANELLRSYGVSGGRIGLTIETDVSLGIDHAIPCALILSELISNSLKYGFPEGRSGEVKITIRSTAEKEIELTVSDNGVGIPEGLDFRNTESFGLRLVSILAENQLHGEVELDRTGGTRFHIKFGVSK